MCMVCVDLGENVAEVIVYAVGGVQGLSAGLPHRGPFDDAHRPRWLHQPVGLNGLQVAAFDQAYIDLEAAIDLAVVMNGDDVQNRRLAWWRKSGCSRRFRRSRHVRKWGCSNGIGVDPRLKQDGRGGVIGPLPGSDAWSASPAKLGMAGRDPATTAPHLWHPRELTYAAIHGTANATI